MDAPQAESVYHCTQHEEVILSPIPPEDKKVKEQEDMKKRSQIMEEHARSLEDQLIQSRKALEDYKNLTEERFNKLAKMISGK